MTKEDIEKETSYHENRDMRRGSDEEFNLCEEKKMKQVDILLLS